MTLSQARPILLCALFTFSPACSGDRPTGDVIDANVTVDSTRQYQVMSGWEVVGQAGQEEARSYPQFRDSLIKAAVNDLGITRIRLGLRSGYENNRDLWAEERAGSKLDFRCARFVTVNDNNDPNTINWDGFKFSQLDYTMENLVLPMKREVEARGERLFLNANYVAFMKLCPDGTEYVHESPNEYAEFVLASYLHMRDKYGIVPDAWEVILEPENTYFWGGRQIGTAIVTTARLLEKHGFKPRFIAPSTTKAGNAPHYFSEMTAVPGVLPYMEELAYHRYRGYSSRDIQAIGAIGERYRIKTAMLEHIGSGYQNLHEDLKLGRVSAWQQFALAYPNKEDDGAQYYLIEDADGPRPKLKMAYRTHYLRQYFRYIRPGAVRLAATSDVSAVDPLAFGGPGLSHVVVVMTTGAAHIRIAGLPAGVYQARYTTESERDVLAPATTDQRGSIKVAIPAAGVVTVFGN